MFSKLYWALFVCVLLIAHSRISTQTEPPVPEGVPNQPLQPLSEEETAQRRAAAIETYYCADTKEEWLSVIRKPWLDGEQLIWPGPKPRPTQIQKLTDLIRGRDTLEIVRVTFEERAPENLLVEQLVSGRFLVAAETSMPQAALIWRQFVKKRASQPKTIRAYVSLSDYYNYAFSDREQHIAVLLEGPGERPPLSGYINRHSDGARRLTRDLQGLVRVPMVLTAHFPNDSNTENQVIIDQVLQNHWITMDDAIRGLDTDGTGYD